jgi:putative sterol carrier protein
VKVENAQEIFTDLIPKAFVRFPDEVAKANCTFKFEVAGDNGGRWLVVLSGDPQVHAASDAEGDCTIIISDINLVKIVQGSLSIQNALFTRKAKVRGKKSLLFNLVTLLIGS